MVGLVRLVRDWWGCRCSKVSVDGWLSFLVAIEATVELSSIS